jgi:phosphoglycolate phosphatase
MFSLVVFDLDGTLIDSIGDLAVAVNRLVAEHDGRPLGDREVAAMVGEGAGLLVARAFAASGATGDAREALPRFLEIYDAILPGATRPYPGVPETLEDAARHAKLAVLTNKPGAATRRLLALLELERYFGEIVGGDGAFRRKPHTDGLLHLMKTAGAGAASTLMVGDSIVDLRTAHEAGVRACVARYGFGQVTFDEAELRGDEYFIDDPRQLLALLES